MPDTLYVNEIFLSVQGESSFAGLPCIFVRLAGCNLRCSYCDTAYAFNEGTRLSQAEVIDRVLELAKPFQPHSHGTRLPIVELTGGEPLLQKGSLGLMKALCESGFSVLLETNGAVDIEPVDPRVHRIMDLKCPSSGEAHCNRWENIRHLKAHDEVKFVIGTWQDYSWARDILLEHRLADLCTVLFSWVSPLCSGQSRSELKKAPADHTPLSRQELVEKIIADALPVRFQLQMHKFIWPPDQRGV